MEPQYMMMGQAAGNIAAFAIRKGLPVGGISVEELQNKLREQGAILHLSQQDKAGAESEEMRKY
jgi:hypothetical protein